MKTVAVFFSDGFEEIEALSPVDYLRRAGLDVTIVGVKGTPFNNTLIVTSSHKVQMITDTTLDEYLKLNTIPDCVVCPGGLGGAKGLASTPELLDLIQKTFDSGKIVAANCASPALVLSKTKVLDGKKWTCYPGMESETGDDLQKNYSNEVFITDGNVVTARGPGASEQFAMELVRILAGQEAFDKIKTGSVLR